MIGAETAIELSRARKAPRWHGLGVFLAIVSLLIQSFVVQPHIDGLTFVHSERAGAVHQLVKAQPSSPAPGVCIICQEAALAGAATLASSPTLLLIAHSFIAATPALLQRVVCRAPSHNWQSRAPPHSI